MTRSFRALTVGLLLAGIPATAFADRDHDHGRDRRDGPSMSGWSQDRRGDRDHRDGGARGDRGDSRVRGPERGRDERRDHGGIGGASTGGYQGGYTGSYQGGYTGYDAGWGSREDLGRLAVLTRACNDSFVGSADAQACVQLARTARVDLTGAISQCANAFVGDAAGLQCLQLMASGAVQPQAIGACENGFVGNEAGLQCMSLLSGSRQDANQLVGYCEQSTIGNEAGLQCLAQFQGR
ncbi:MAG TPA: hypothetical protein VHE35_15315 [Kofleriaceae bacterium]|nr:hypothetical protein [Kofleriaceae bacterium]